MIVIGDVTVHHGNCLDVLATMGDCTVDSVVTDPPYELGFMGKDWDNSGIAYRVDLWREVLRVLKPGGHLLAFGGTRTYHRMAVAIEDAGFEIRDSIHWVYGSGFPKSHDVSKGIDKRGGSIPWQREFAEHLKRVKPKNITAAQINSHVALNGSKSNFWGHFTDTKSQPLLPTVEQYVRLREIVPIDQEWDEQFLPEAERKVIGKSDSTLLAVAPGEGRDRPPVTLDITAAATDAAKQWEGWGTALKPAHEPIVVARRPLIGTVAANVLEHGTGALNIDGARIGTDDTLGRERGGWGNAAVGATNYGNFNSIGVTKEGGRWPANVIFDPDAAAELDRQEPGASRFFYIAKPSKAERNAGLEGLPEQNRNDQSSWVRECGVCGCRFTDPTTGKPKCEHDDVRFTSPSPTKNPHPTVKPLQLMRYLIRLVTPPGGTVLEPFAGSGTTLMAATIDGFASIGIELTDDYLPIIEGRVRWAQRQQQELW